MRRGNDVACDRLQMRWLWRWNETVVDESAGSRQAYVEDCQICCKPNLLAVQWDRSAREYIVRAELES